MNIKQIIDESDLALFNVDPSNKPLLEQNLKTFDKYLSELSDFHCKSKKQASYVGTAIRRVTKAIEHTSKLYTTVDDARIKHLELQVERLLDIITKFVP